MLNETAMTFLADRGLDPETADRHGWYSDGNELVIPYLRGGEVVNRKYRGLDDKRFRQDRDGAKVLWNVDCLADCEGHDVVITEGEMDALALLANGHTWVCSVPDGAPVKTHDEDYDGPKYGYLDTGTLAQLRKASSVILATDGDKPGQNLAADLAMRIGRAHCRHVRYPKIDRAGTERCKDLNDTLIRWGPAALTEVVTKAEWWNRPSVRRMSEIPPAPTRDIWPPGIAGFDDLFRFRLGDLSVWTGVPGHGKSAFINHLLATAVMKYGWQVTFASFEQDPATDHRRNLRCWYLDGTDPDYADAGKRAAADAWIDAHFSFVCADLDVDDEVLNLAWIIDCIRAAVVRYEARIFVIDPWNELEHDRPQDMTMTDYVGRAIRELRRQAQSLNVHLMVVAHPAKLKGDDGPPGLYQISDSAHWANKPDQGVVVWRDIESGVSTVYVKKCRYDVLGRLGKQDFKFNALTKRFWPVCEDEAQYAQTGFV